MSPARKSPSYVPDRGDAVWLTLDPQAGHEQSGRRPAVVISPRAYNGRAGPEGLAVGGAVLADQVHSLDWHARRAARICELPAETMDEVLGKLEPLLER